METVGVLTYYFWYMTICLLSIWRHLYCCNCIQSCVATTLLQAITMATFTNLIALSFLLGMVLTVSSFKLEERKSTASWVSLCDGGHSYLFSEETADWAESSVMCEELGGYLVRIENRHENNCILVHAQKQGLHHYWWTSGTVNLQLV